MEYLAEPEPRPVRRSVHALPAGLAPNQPNGRSIAVSPDGSMIAYEGGGALYLRRLNELEARLIPGTEGENPQNPMFSPDGEWLLFKSGVDQELKRVATAGGGTPLPVATVGPETVSWRWTDDDTIHFCDGSQILAVAPTGGELRTAARVQGARCFNPVAIPNTDLFLYMQVAASGLEIAVQSTATGQATPLFPGIQPYYIEPYIVYTDPNLGLTVRPFDVDSLSAGSAVGFGYDIYRPAPNGGMQFDLADNGTLIYIENLDASAPPSEGVPLSILDRAGNLRQLGAPLDDYRFPAASPLGDQIAVQVVDGNASHIFVYEVSGASEIRQLTSEGNNAQPVWSKDGGEWIVFSSDRGGRRRLWRKRANGRGDAEPVTSPPDGHVQTLPAFTSDGARLAWTENGPGIVGQEIWIMDYPDGEPELLVSTGGAAWGIAFSPDGAAMSYAMAMSTEGSVSLMLEPYPKEPGPGVRLSADGNGGAWPVWSRDSQQLSYQIPPDGTFGILDVDTGSLSWSNRRLLGISAVSRPGREPGRQRLADSLPGEDALVVALRNSVDATQTGSGSRRLIIVENWIEEVRQRVPAD